MDFSKCDWVIGFTIDAKTRESGATIVGRFCETPILLDGVWHRRPTILTARRRRVLEDGCAEKRRFDPMRSQRRNFGKVNGRSRSADQWRMSGMIVVTRGDHCRRAAVLDPIRICVKAVMQLRRGTQRERPDKCRGNANRNKCASTDSSERANVLIALRPSDRVVSYARLFCRVRATRCDTELICCNFEKPILLQKIQEPVRLRRTNPKSSPLYFRRRLSLQNQESCSSHWLSSPG